MVKQIWINLPVKDLNASKSFFIELGFKSNSGPGNTENSASLLVGEKNVVVMLFTETVFKQFINDEIANIFAGNEMLISIDAESKDEVDQMAQRVVVAGGTTTHTPTEMTGFMYSCLFTDLDGHKWNILYMDPDKIAG